MISLDMLKMVSMGLIEESPLCHMGAVCILVLLNLSVKIGILMKVEVGWVNRPLIGVVRQK